MQPEAGRSYGDSIGRQLTVTEIHTNDTEGARGRNVVGTVEVDGVSLPYATSFETFDKVWTTQLED